MPMNSEVPLLMALCLSNKDNTITHILIVYWTDQWYNRTQD